ncbi:peptidoglycan-binding protein [Litorisediminicola beolgyonensis]|uniref:Peptidoglycan-binding protein n=1 Tax=Litorisediminicola beolgyonensis TaxID=1173614 RepID=A0ABW3ZIC9_9RHOB
MTALARTIALVLATVPGLALAETDVFMVEGRPVSFIERFGAGSGLRAAEDPLLAQGAEVALVTRASQDELRAALAGFMSDIDEATDRVAVVLSGRFVHSATETYLLAPESDISDFAGAVTEGLALSAVTGLLAEYPGRAVLMLGTLDGAQVEGMRSGIGETDWPQGVTVISGRAQDVAELASDHLPRPGRALLPEARRAGLSVAGYAPEGFVFLPERGAQAPAPSREPQDTQPSADDRLWQSVSDRDEITAYRDYLAAFPQGRHASEARSRIAAIEADPFRDARRAEESLGLSREARREVQRDLELLGFDPRGIDGIFGQGTRAAIRRWQEASGQDVTSYLDGPQVARLGAEASRRAAELQEEAQRRQAELEREDRAYWQRTGEGGGPGELRAYLERYPDGLYADIARDRLDRFEAEARERAESRDREAWQAAQNGNTVASYRDYLATFPQGAFAGQAQARIAELGRSTEDRQARAQVEAEEARLGLNRGARRIAEDRLRVLQFNPGKVDGKFDKRTRSAIRRYQETRQLRVTGYLDQQTVVRLLAESLIR